MRNSCSINSGDEYAYTTACTCTIDECATGGNGVDDTAYTNGAAVLQLSSLLFIYRMSQDYRLKLSRHYEKRLAKESVEVIKGQKMVNCVTYRIPLEDHTVGDLLRIYLLKHKDVKFAGYKQVHPLDDTLEVRVQTVHEDTNKVVKDTLMMLQKDLFDMEITFERVAKEKSHDLT